MTATSSNHHRPQQLLYTQVRDEILADLATVGVAEGERYYTEGELVGRYQVSRNTIRRAMDDLEKRGYLQRHRRLGIIVRKLPGKPAPVPAVDPPVAPSAAQPQRLITMLPRWDDSTEGFYAARILRELTATDALRPYAIEIRHPDDALDLPASPSITCLAMDPSPHATVRLAQLAAEGVRVVLLAPSMTQPFALNLCDDTRAGAMQAAQLLRDSGHAHVGIVLQDLRHRDYQMAMHGYLDAHAAAGLPILSNGIVRYFNGTEIHPVVPIDVDRITGWIATFRGAVAVLGAACAAAGKRVADDVSIIGFDDPGDNDTTGIGKRLTVVRPCPSATARAVADCLVNWDDSLRGQAILLPMEYVARESVGPHVPNPIA